MDVPRHCARDLFQSSLIYSDHFLAIQGPPSLNKLDDNYHRNKRLLTKIALIWLLLSTHNISRTTKQHCVTEATTMNMLLVNTYLPGYTAQVYESKNKLRGYVDSSRPNPVGSNH